MCDKLENRGDLIFGILVKKLKYIDVFFILGIVYHHWKRRGGRRERKREEGERGGLWTVPHIKLNKFMQGQRSFLGGEFLWRGRWEKGSPKQKSVGPKKIF